MELKKYCENVSGLNFFKNRLKRTATFNKAILEHGFEFVLQEGHWAITARNSDNLYRRFYRNKLMPYGLQAMQRSAEELLRVTRPNQIKNR